MAVQAGDPDSVLQWYRRLLRLRRATPAVKRGGQRLLDVGEADVLAFTRDVAEGAAFVALNFGDAAASISVPPVPGAGAGAWRLALSTHPRADAEVIAGSVTLAPLEALIAVGP